MLFRSRAAGNGADDFFFNFELTCQFATITNIIAGTRIADLFLVPAMDATNYASTDEGTASVLNIPAENYVGGFTSHKQLVATTDYRFYSGPILIQPLLYKAFIGNRSGQTISANWTLKAIGVQGQYT